MPTHQTDYNGKGVTGRELEQLMDFYKPQSKREEEILERVRVTHCSALGEERYKDEIRELERLFRIERARLTTVNPDNLQPIIVVEETSQIGG